MMYPFVKKFGGDYQQIREPGIENRFRVINGIVAGTPLNSEQEFLIDLDTWNKLPWSGWELNAHNYISCCGVQMHRVVAYLNGMLNDRNFQVVDHANKNKLDNRKENLRPCNSIQNGWNSEHKHGHKLKNGQWKFTFRKSFPTYQEAEDEIRLGRFQYMNENRTCYTEATFDTYEEGLTWWKFNAGIHYGEFSPFANPYKTCEQILKESSERC